MSSFTGDARSFALWAAAFGLGPDFLPDYSGVGDDRIGVGAASPIVDQFRMLIVFDVSAFSES
jgi:hypothetical protein